ncbi:hypothetical protein AAEH76_03895, partial [Shewanella algae]|uniref:hypothetical protein n=1 Tax=Shewanella algae TaxID=38313 RepID=UPI00313E5A08
KEGELAFIHGRIWMPKQRQSNQGRVSPSDELTSARQDVELGQSHMDVTLSVWRDSELAS